MEPYVTVGWRFRRACAVAVVVVALIAARTEPTAPDAGPEGRQLLRDAEYAAWEWHPNSAEIVFGTRSELSDSRIEAVNISDGRRRTIVPAMPAGARISPFRFQIVGMNVYFTATRDDGRTSLLRSRLDGSSTPQMVMDSLTRWSYVSPDETQVAWVNSTGVAPFVSLVILHVATGTRREYSLSHAGDVIEWSSSGKTIVVHPSGVFGEGTPFQVVDVETGIIRPWIGSRNEIDIDMRRHFGWDGENPSLYLTGGNVVARYSLSSGVKTILRTVTDPAHAIGWNANFTTVTLASNICLQEGTGPFGGDCILWSASMDRLDLVTGATVNILKSKSPYLIDGQLSPGGASIAYLFGNCATGCTDAAGLYVTSSN